MAASDFFDPKTQNGFLNKNLENRRRKLQAEEKRWVWSKKLRAEDINVNEESNQGTDTSTDSLPSTSARVVKNVTANMNAEISLLDVDGCSRGFASCNICTSKLLLHL